MNRCSFCEWIPILPWPVWPLAGQSLLGQNVVVGSMMVLLALCGSMPRGVYLGPHFRYKCASPLLSAELPIFYLPKYSPELNPIEILWRFIKYEWIELDAYKSWTHLVNYVENVLQNFGEKYKIIFV